MGAMQPTKFDLEDPQLNAINAALIRDATTDDFAQILALNEASVHFLSPMNQTLLSSLHASAAYHRVVEIDGIVKAFLLALREGASYGSVNFRWFCERYTQFLYIDRVVVAASAQGLGLGAILYADLLIAAKKAGVSHVTCEFDIDPPNARSLRFHAKFGFVEVGSQHVGPQQKKVSLQAVTLPQSHGAT